MASSASQLSHVGEAAIEVLERQHWLDSVATGLQKAVSGAFEAGGDMGRRIRDAIIGLNDSATNADTITEPATATANSMNNRPVALF